MKIEELKKCDLFKYKIITNAMKKVVQDTINTKKERGFAICLDQKDKLFPHEIISGTRSRLKYQLRCPKDKEGRIISYSYWI